MSHTGEPGAPHDHHGAGHHGAGHHGRILHSARAYDVLVWFFLRGRESVFRRRTLDLANLAPGDAVLDIGCGTGSLAIEAKRRLPAREEVCGVNASPEMVSRARQKAERARVAVSFEQATALSLPFPDAHFDVVLSSLMFHHLAPATRDPCAREVRRVLKPGGRVVIVDFGTASGHKGGLLRHFHRQGHTDPDEIVRALGGAGISLARTGPLGIGDLHFVIGTVP